MRRMMEHLKLIDVTTITAEEATAIWDRVRLMDVCFDDFMRGRADAFAARLASPATAAFLYDEFGMVTIENIVPGLSATIHFFAWKPLQDADMVKVGREAMSYAFETYQLNRITASYPAFNKLAARIGGRIGFKYEGNIRESWMHKGKLYDLYVTGMLRRDWRP